METYRDRASSFFGDFTLGGLVRITCMCIQRLRRLCDDSISHGVGCDQFAFTLVPFSEYFGRGSTPQDAGVDETRESNVRDMTRRAKDALKVPNCLCSVVPIVRWNRSCTGLINIRFGIYLIQETASILAIKNTGKSPGLVLEGLHVLNLHEQDIAWFRGFDVERSGEIVDLGEIYVLHIVGRVVVLDLSARPVETFDLDDFIVGDFTMGRDWGVPMLATH